jgi:hypothetical protein
MKRGPVPGAFKKTDSVANMRAAWGDTPPDWLQHLAEACNHTSQAAVARRIGYSGAVLSSLFKGKYKGDLTAVEKAVRGALMAEKIDCPGLHMQIPGHDCLDWQKRARKLSAASPLSVSMYRACRGRCPHSRLKGNTYAE